jgi:hypothetical protein
VTHELKSADERRVARTWPRDRQFPGSRDALEGLNIARLCDLERGLFTLVLFPQNPAFSREQRRDWLTLVINLWAFDGDGE